MSLGWAALAIAFFAWVAEADGLLALPRLGRVAIRTGGLEPPFAFSVRRGARVLLFVCDEDPERGGWSDVYTVLDRPKLEQMACECYAVVKKETDRLAPPSAIIAPPAHASK